MVQRLLLCSIACISAMAELASGTPHGKCSICKHMTLCPIFLMCVCTVPQVNGYPSSPFSTRPFIFVNQFQELDEKPSVLLTKKNDPPCREVHAFAGRSLPVHIPSPNVHGAPLGNAA
jgi:hypothetical protein